MWEQSFKNERKIKKLFIIPCHCSIDWLISKCQSIQFLLSLSPKVIKIHVSCLWDTKKLNQWEKMCQISQNNERKHQLTNQKSRLTKKEIWLKKINNSFNRHSVDWLIDFTDPIFPFIFKIWNTCPAWIPPPPCCLAVQDILFAYFV